jgi:hypothetical protein
MRKFLGNIMLLSLTLSLCTLGPPGFALPRAQVIGGITAQGQTFIDPTDPLGVLAFGGPVAPGSLGTAYWPLITGGLDPSGNVQPASLNVNKAQNTQVVAGVTGGVTIQKLNSAGSTNATSIKTTPGIVYTWTLTDTAAYAVYVHFYNKASAPTVGTDVPAFTIGIPAGVSVNSTNEIGYQFTTGVAIAVTKGYGDTDAVATLAGDLVGVIGYK